MTIPATTTPAPQPDEGNRGERRAAHLRLVREESPVVVSFPKIPTVAQPLGVFATSASKPLAAFEAPPADTATTPVTWGSGNS